MSIVQHFISIKLIKLIELVKLVKCMFLILPSTISFQRHSVVIASLGQWVHIDDRRKSCFRNCIYAGSGENRNECETNMASIRRKVSFFNLKHTHAHLPQKSHNKCVQRHTNTRSDSQTNTQSLGYTNKDHCEVFILLLIWCSGIDASFLLKIKHRFVSFGFVWQMRKLFRFVASDKEK